MAEDNVDIEVTGFTSLKAQIREATLEFQKLQSSGTATAAEIDRAAARVGALKDEFADATETAKSLGTAAGKFGAVTKALSGVAGGFTAIQGAIGLAGGDAKEFEKTMQKVQSAMALSTGLSQLSELGDSFGNLKKVAVNAFSSIKAAMASTGILLLVTAVGYLVTHMEELGLATKTDAERADDLAKSNEKLKTSIDLNNQSIDAETTLLKAQGVELKKINDMKIKGLEIANQQLAAKNQELTLEMANLSHLSDLNYEMTKEEQEAYDKLEEQRKQNEINITKNNAAILGLKEEVITEEKKKNDKAAADATKAEQDRQALADKALAKKVKALESQKALDLADIEGRRLVAVEAAKTEEEKATVENSFAIEKANREAKFESDREELRKKEEKDAVALAAALKNIDNQKVDANAKLNHDLDKLAKERAEKEKKDQQDREAAVEKEYDDTLGYLEDYYKTRETAILNAGLTEEELSQQLYTLELERLEALKVAAKDYGKSVIDIDNEIAKLKQNNRKKDKEETAATDKEKFDLAVQTATQLVSTLQAINDASMQQELTAAGDNVQKQEEIKKDYFEKNKNLAIAQATISTIQGSIDAYVGALKVDPTTITSTILASLVLASGFANIAKIKATQYQSTGAAKKEASSSGSMYAQGGLLSGPSHDLGGIKTSMGELEGGEFIVNRRATANFLPMLNQINASGNTPGPEMPQQQQQPIIKTYVVASDMSSQQEANAKLQALSML
ncbi:hypothetical protein UFOVP693_8 [uncultured Caudovirales phage]|uniref:Uncharacterized protein n=1 Tax=uncultured Caudovirales phage TaxID=2100421 RepID=A0A6J5NH91_9CAUD|nr:hypothetical protein UFOVP693_8 [uncultured Caudovirales phage]